MKHKKSLLVVLTIVFASCGGGNDNGGVSSSISTIATVNNPIQAVAILTSGFLLMPAVY